jgi:hypothetical protein
MATVSDVPEGYIPTGVMVAQAMMAARIAVSTRALLRREAGDVSSLARS